MLVTSNGLHFWEAPAKPPGKIQPGPFCCLSFSNSRYSSGCLRSTIRSLKQVALAVLGRFCGLLQFLLVHDLFGSAKTSGDPEATLQ